MLDLRPGDRIFGFGSLVNAKTWPRALKVQSAQLSGYRREWRHSATMPSGERVNAVTLTEAHGITVDGVVETLREEDVEPLKIREIGYRTIDVTDAVQLEAGKPEGRIVALYSTGEYRRWSSPDTPILQSYVDVVLDGYETRFGHDGLMRFLDTTHGWSGTIVPDRDQPRYPRSVALPAETLARYDALVEERRQAELAAG
jgi:cation transport protein ChaC